MTSSDGLRLDGVVLLGRTFDEYLRCFGLAAADLQGGRVLDVGGGVSSFTAEACARGADATAVDPVYAVAANEIERKCEADLEHVMAQLATVQEKYRWDYYRDVEHLREIRTHA